MMTSQMILLLYRKHVSVPVHTQYGIYIYIYKGRSIRNYCHSLLTTNHSKREEINFYVTYIVYMSRFIIVHSYYIV
jgi:hypothetical protein